MACAISHKKTMKVLIVTTAFPRWKNDIRAPFIYEAALSIRQKGINVSVLAMHNPGAKTKEIWDGINIWRPRYLPERYETLQREEGGLPVTWKNGGLSRLSIISFIIIHSLSVMLRASKVDLIHANWTLSAGCVWITKWFHRKPYLVTVHGSDIFQAGKIPIIRWFTRIILGNAEKVIAVSKALAIALIDIGVDEDLIEIIPNGVNIQRFKPSSNYREKILLFVGALTKVKGGDTLLLSFPKVLSQFPDYRLVLVGDGPCRLEWETLAKELGIFERVEFTGLASREEVANWMRKAKIFVLPSRSEGLGVVLLEALASGTPCIGTASGGIVDIIDDNVGKLVPPDDPIRLSNQIIEFINNPSKYEARSRAARFKAEQEYDWNQIAERNIIQYKVVLKQRS